MAGSSSASVFLLRMWNGRGAKSGSATLVGQELASSSGPAMRLEAAGFNLGRLSPNLIALSFNLALHLMSFDL